MLLALFVYKTFEEEDTHKNKILEVMSVLLVVSMLTFKIMEVVL